MRTGNRYTVEDLEGLEGDQRDFLATICCTIAFGRLWARRPHVDDRDQHEAQQAAKEQIEMLRAGEHIFDIDKVVEATKIEAVAPDAIAIRQQNLLVDYMRGRNGFLPHRRHPRT